MKIRRLLLAPLVAAAGFAAFVVRQAADRAPANQAADLEN